MRRCVVVAVLCVLAGCSGKKEEVSFVEADQIEVARTRATQLATAIKTYYVDYGSWPESLQALCKGGPQGGPYIPQEALVDPWKQQFQVDFTGQQFHNGAEPDIWTTSPSGKVVGNFPEGKLRQMPAEPAPAKKLPVGFSETDSASTLRWIAETVGLLRQDRSGNQIARAKLETNIRVTLASVNGKPIRWKVKLRNIDTRGVSLMPVAIPVDYDQATRVLQGQEEVPPKFFPVTIAHLMPHRVPNLERGTPQGPYPPARGGQNWLAGLKVGQTVTLTANVSEIKYKLVAVQGKPVNHVYIAFNDGAVED